MVHVWSGVSASVAARFRGLGGGLLARVGASSSPALGPRLTTPAHRRRYIKDAGLTDVEIVEIDFPNKAHKEPSYL